jgi:protein-disulfide isomerase
MFRLVSVGVCAAALALACSRSTDDKLDRLLEGQKTSEKLDQVLAKLNDLERKVDAIQARGVAGGQPQQRPAPPAPDPAATYAVPVDAGDPAKGPRNAKVTIVEAAEFA